MTKILLNVGCGGSSRKDVHPRFQGAEWEHVRVDIDPSVSPDVVDDIRTLSKIEDASVDAIFSSHNLEHLHLYDIHKALATFHQKLRVGGILAINVPDFQEACKRVGEGRGLDMVYMSPAGPITAVDMIFGFNALTYTNQYQQHRFGFTKRTLKEFLIGAGYANVECIALRESFDIWAFARRVDA